MGGADGGQTKFLGSQEAGKGVGGANREGEEEARREDAGWMGMWAVVRDGEF